MKNAFNDALSQMYEASRPAPNGEPDLVCFSHLRWDFIYQRPQHLLSRAARTRRVFFIEEPVFDDGSMYLELSQRDCGVWVGVPHLPEGLQSSVAREAVQRGMIDRLFGERAVRDFVAWYYTPMALSFTRSLRPLATIYDCMDELSAFKDAPPALREREAEIFERADLVFTGGQSLYEAKRQQHHAVYAFPSSIDYPHFAQARDIIIEPEDQRSIPHPRLGFFGVIDERLDLHLLDGLAAARPDWHVVMVGPVVKIDPATLPCRPNIHYLGGKSYKELPAYLANWDVALLLFARNDSTRFISPTKTPEYLAAGKPVVSTSIQDVVRAYEDSGMVRIADTTDDFVEAVEAALSEPSHRRSEWLAHVDEFLAHTSWDQTWAQMSQLIENAVSTRRAFVASAQQGAAAKSLVAGASASRVS